MIIQADRVFRAVPAVSFTRWSLLAAVLLLGCLPSHAAEVPPRTVSVTGEAEQEVMPDMALITAQVVVLNSDAAAARAEADTVSARALAVLRSLEIDDEDIDSSALNIAPRYRWDNERREQRQVGYQVTRSITARLKDLTRLGALMIQLSDAGINQVQPPQLRIQDEESLHQSLLVAAAQNARQRAQTLATALGETLAGVQSVGVRGQPQPRPMAAERMMVAADAAPSPEASYQAGTLSYRVVVDASFLLQ
jgi:uncharacterized protein YggE